MTDKETKLNMIGLIRKECENQGVTDGRQIAYILATTEWETNHTYGMVREAYWCSEGWRKRHLRYYPYYGRGPCQITWEANYEKFGALLGVDLVNHPDLALYPAYGAFIIVYGMKHGAFTGKKLDHYFTKSTENWIGARRIINGQDKAHTVASIAKYIYENNT